MRSRVTSVCATLLSLCLGCGTQASHPIHRRHVGVGAAGGTEVDSGDPALIDAGMPAAGYWAGTLRDFARAPSGNVAAVNCHNCYEQTLGSTDANLEGTLARLHAAQNAGADLLELDTRLEGGTWYVAHDDDGTTDKAHLEDVIADDAVVAGDQLLFLEIKEDQAPDRAALSAFLHTIWSLGYAAEGRDVVLRAFNMRIEQLRTLHALISAGEPAADASRHFRLHVLYPLADTDNLDSAKMAIDSVANEGFTGVEFNYMGSHVFDLLDHARSLALGTNVWTFGSDDGSALCAEFRDVSDAVTTDSPLRACRAAIQER